MNEVDQAKKNLDEREKTQKELREARERQEKNLHEKKEGEKDAQKERQKLLKEYDDETDPERREALKKQIAEYHQKAKQRDHSADRSDDRLRILGQKIKWGAKRVTKLRKNLKQAKKEAKKHPTPAAWQGNGHEWSYLTSNAQKLLAIAVVQYGLVCTSIFRTWGTGSFHEDKPTRGFDCAGSRMVEFQNDLRQGRIEGFSLGDLLELFGPDNDACADNGAPYVMSEGSGNEQLHDNHVHAFVY